MVRTQISMTERQAEALRRLAAARQVSQAAVLREALDSLVDLDERARRVALARSAIGAFNSGTTDTARDHDAVLDEAFST